MKARMQSRGKAAAMENEYSLKQVQVRLKLSEAEPLYSTEPLNSPERAVDVMAGMLAQLDRECCCVVNLDNALRPINFNVVSIGGINQAQIPIQNIFKAAILSNASQVMAFHNHPSGSLNPSREDIMITQKLVEAGRLMEIPVTDHIIVGGGTGERYSFRTEQPWLFEAGAKAAVHDTGGVVREGTAKEAQMKEYDITITETLEKTVTVQAESRKEAETAVRDAWKNAEYVLGADDFTDVSFGVLEERELKLDRITALLVEPGEYPKTVEIGTGLKNLQEAVGGDIETVYPFEDNVAIICNEEGKIGGLPLNRALRDENGEVYDIIAGSFLVTGLTEESFGSLSPEQMEKFEKMFHQPEAFIRMGRGIMAVPIPDDMVKSRAAEKPPAEKAKDSKSRDAL